MGGSRPKGIFADNEKQTLDAAKDEFPDVKVWEQKPEWGDRIYVADSRKKSDKTNFKDELRDAQILRDNGSTVCLVPESRRKKGSKFDAFVDGEKMELKNVKGGSNAIQKRFLESRMQAPNVFINTSKTDFTVQDVFTALNIARNKQEAPKSHGYDYYNKFPQGGIIVIKVKGRNELIKVSVDYFKD